MWPHCEFLCFPFFPHYSHHVYMLVHVQRNHVIIFAVTVSLCLFLYLKKKLVTFLAHVTRTHEQPQVALNCFAFFFTFLFSIPSASYKTGLFFKPTSEGRVHNVGQQIRASCWLHIAADAPADKHKYINFPNPHTGMPVFLFPSRECCKLFYIVSHWDSQWTARMF